MRIKWRNLGVITALIIVYLLTSNYDWKAIKFPSIERPVVRFYTARQALSIICLWLILAIAFTKILAARKKGYFAGLLMIFIIGAFINFNIGNPVAIVTACNLNEKYSLAVLIIIAIFICGLTNIFHEGR